MTYKSLAVTRKLADAVNEYAGQEIFSEAMVGDSASIGTAGDGEILLADVPFSTYKFQKSFVQGRPSNPTLDKVFDCSGYVFFSLNVAGELTRSQLPSMVFFDGRGHTMNEFRTMLAEDSESVWGWDAASLDSFIGGQTQWHRPIGSISPEKAAIIIGALFGFAEIGIDAPSAAQEAAAASLREAAFGESL